MNPSKQLWIRAGVAVLIAFLIATLGHIIIPGIPEPFPFSDIVQVYGVPLVALTYLGIVFPILAVIFVVMRNNIPGTKIEKGLRYGVSLGSVWFLGIIEISIITGTDLVTDSLMALPDTIALIFMGLLLAHLTTTDIEVPPESKQDHQIKNGIITISVIASIFIIGRYFSYAIIGIDSTYLENMVGTLVFTISLGLVIGMMYWFVSPGVKGESEIAHASWFSVVVFGFSWSALQLFMPLFYASISVESILIRTGFDIIYVIVGVILVRYLMHSSSS